jgi:translation initiation factor IF-2
MTGEEVTLKPPVTVRDLADVIRRKPFQVIADLMELGIFANVNQTVETDVAQKVAAKHGIRLRVTKRTGPAEVQKAEPKKDDRDADDKPEDLKPRAPVVTIMGHVDHGKTSLLDVIRKSNVVAGEAGGITQHIGAYTIQVPHPDRPRELAPITFLDTPGHAAFSAMRARGAHVTDIVVLVVAANDGVMPQTLEALNHARDAGVPIVVAVNKIDHPNAQPLRVRQQLQERGLVPDDWGGDTQFVDVSALTKQGVDKLLGAILLQAELLELRANPNRSARGNVVESGIEPGGPTATLLVRKGTLRPGQVIVCGEYHGKIRALLSADGTRLKEAGPSTAVKVLGLNGAPAAGLEFSQVESEREAREITEARRLESRALDRTPKAAVRLEDFLNRIDGADARVLRVVLKGDTQGSVEAILGAFKDLPSDKVTLQVIHSDVGAITESDVQLAATGERAIILGFHTRVDNSAAELAKREGVQIKLYAIIYELIDEVKVAMAGLLPPVLKENVFGTAEVRKVFTLSKGGTVAGCLVTSGRVTKGKVRVVRRRNVLFEGILQTLRRFQDDVNEVRAGMECGIRLDNFNDFQEGDIVECYSMVEVQQTL